MMIMMVLTGLVVFDEIKYYSELQLLAIFGSILISFIGIKFLTMKTKMMKFVPESTKAEVCQVSAL